MRKHKYRGSLKKGPLFCKFPLAILEKMVYTILVITPAGVMGSEPTAASGGVKGGERVAGVDEGRRRSVAEDIRRGPQQADQQMLFYSL